MELLGKKARSDLFGNRSRILTALLAMVLGTVVFGTFTFTQAMINREIDVEFNVTNPASATILVDRVDENLLALLNDFDGISDYEVGAAHELAMFRPDGKLKKVWLSSSDSFEQREINMITPVEGSFVPGSNDVLVDSDALGLANAKLGDDISLRLPNGSTQSYKISGLVNDLSQHPPSIHDNVYVYVSSEVLTDMGLSMNRIDYLVSGNPYDKGQIMEVSQQLIHKLTDSGYRVGTVQVSKTPGVSMHREEYKGVLFILQVFSVVAFLFGCIIMSSLFSTILAGQVKQIGILKAIGAKTPNIIASYMGAATILIACNLAVSIPLSGLAARELSVFFMSIGNMKIRNFMIPSYLYVIFFAASIVVPFVLALIPVQRGIKTTVKEAIIDCGTEMRRVKKDIITELLQKNVSRPVLFSIRGAMENRRRFSMNIAMLTLGGIMFVSIMGVVISVNMAVSKSVDAQLYDYQIVTGTNIEEETLAQAVESHENVAEFEIWGQSSGQLMYPNGNTGNTYGFSAVPSDTAMYKPNLMEGRWLEPSDTNAIVVSFEFFRQEPDFALGSRLLFQFAGVVEEFEIVGIINEVGDSSIYISKEGFEEIVPSTAQRSSINLTTNHKGERKSAMYNSISQSISDNGISILQATTKSDSEKIVSSHFSTTLTSFTVVAILAVIVAGFGLATTMTVQVNERTREIGILKSIGANHKQVFSIITAESTYICLFSFMLCLVLGVPFTWGAIQIIGISILEIPLGFSPLVILASLGIWLVAIFAVGRLASKKAAKRAAEFTVKTALAIK